jgi:hypothetical protein
LIARWFGVDKKREKEGEFVCNNKEQRFFVE